MEQVAPTNPRTNGPTDLLPPVLSRTGFILHLVEDPDMDDPTSYGYAWSPGSLIQTRCNPTSFEPGRASRGYSPSPIYHRIAHSTSSDKFEGPPLNSPKGTIPDYLVVARRTRSTEGVGLGPTKTLSPPSGDHQLPIKGPLWHTAQGTLFFLNIL